jgi:hypothetical protein
MFSVVLNKNNQISLSNSITENRFLVLKCKYDVHIGSLKSVDKLLIGYSLYSYESIKKETMTIRMKTEKSILKFNTIQLFVLLKTIVNDTQSVEQNQKPTYKLH